jgi:cytoskeletal protein CcmA (bactofilin family)
MWNREASPTNDVARPPLTSEPAVTNRPSDERRVVAWMGKSVIFKGDLISSEDLTIDGRVEGTIEVRDHALTIGPDAEIRANIIAKAVTVHGSVTGTITASDKVDVRETGSVDGDITSPRLALTDGAVVRGRVETLPRPVEANNPRRLAIVG